MAFDAGLSFSPGTSPDKATAMSAQNQTSGQTMNPIQEAIRTLAMRIPRSGGMQGAINPYLLRGQGMAGMGPGMDWMQLLQRAIGAQQGFPGGAPVPQVTPGINPMPGGPVQPPPGGYHFDPSGQIGNGGISFGGPTQSTEQGGITGQPSASVHPQITPSFASPSFRLWG